MVFAVALVVRRKVKIRGRWRKQKERGSTLYQKIVIQGEVVAFSKKEQNLLWLRGYLGLKIFQVLQHNAYEPVHIEKASL